MNSRKFNHHLIAFVILALSVLVPAGAHADGQAEKKQQAKEHYEKATRLYDVGKYSDAIGEYEAAYLLIEDAALLFNIGQAYRLWDRPEDAIRAYKNYLRRRPEASNRTDVEKKIADLEKLGEDRRRDLAAPPAATAPAALPQIVTPALPEPLPSSASPVAPEGAPTPAAAQPVGVAFAQPAAGAPPSSPPATKRNWLAYSLIGVGGVCLVTTVIAAAVGASKTKKLQEASQNHDPFDPAVQANGKSANALAFVSAVAGLASGGIGGYLLWRGHGAAPATAVVVPTVTPGFAGGSAQLTF